MKLANKIDKKKVIIVNLSGRGDKDLNTAAREMGVKYSDE